MTVREQQEGFEILIKQIDPSLGLKLVSTDIEYFLTAAQEELISRKFSGNNVYETEFEETIKRVEDLRDLHKIELDIASTTNISNIANSVYFDLSSVSDYVFYVKSFCDITRTDTNPTTFVTPNNLIKTRDIDDFISTSFNSPILREPKCILLEGRGLLVIHDIETTINTLDLHYIRKPKKLTSFTLGSAAYPIADYTNTSELPEYTHQEMIKTAVRMAVGSYDPQLYQIKSNDENKSE